MLYLKMKKFPVKVDLSIFFKDERKFVIILVDPKWKSVEYLQHRVEEIFDVGPVHFLTNDNLFIPPQESIEVVEYTEALRAFIPKHAVEKCRKRSKIFDIPYVEENNDNMKNTEDLDVGKESGRKRKYYTLGTEILSSSTPNNAKKTRCTPITAPKKSKKFICTNEQTGLFKILEKHSPIEYEDKGNTSSAGLCTDSDYTRTQKREQYSTVKKKRKRVCKETTKGRGNFKEAAKTLSAVNSMSIGPKIPSSTLINHSRSLNKSSHIIFDNATIVNAKPTTENTTSTTVSEKELSSKITFKCKIIEKDIGKPLIFPLKLINQQRKPLIDIKENILLPPADIENLIKEKVKPESNTKLDYNNLANIAEMPKSVVVERNENKNFVVSNNLKETEFCLDAALNEKTANVDIPNDRINLDESLVRVNKDLEESHLKENPGKVDEIDLQIEVSKRTENVNGVNTEESTHNVSHQKEHSKEKSMKSFSDDCDSGKIKKKDNKSKPHGTISKNNMEDLENLSPLEESCVIDLDDDDEDVIDLSDAVEEQKAAAVGQSEKLSETLNKSISEMGVKDMLPFCTPLTGTLKVGDVVVFKFNRKVLSDKKEVSEFIACKCDHINRRTKVLKLYIIDASQENDIIPHQYSYNLDESLNNGKYMTIKLTELIQPKVLEIE